MFDQKIKHQQRLSMISIDEQLLGESLEEDNDDNYGQQKYNDRRYLNQSMPIKDEAGISLVNES